MCKLEVGYIMRVSGVSDLYRNRVGCLNKQNCKIANFNDIHSNSISFKANPLKFKSKVLKNISIVAMAAAPAAGPLAIGISLGTYIADKLIDDDDDSITKKGDK